MDFTVYKKISDYGIIGDLKSIALIGLDGSIDWMCLPYIDSPGIFSALLDDGKGGRFSVSPVEAWESAAEYISATNILQTRFRTETGVMKVTDFMPVCACGREEMEEERHELYRLIEIPQGQVRVKVIFDPRFDYARNETSLTTNNTGIIAEGKNEVLVLSCSREINIPDNTRTVEWDLSEGERVWLHLNYGEVDSYGFNEKQAESALAETETYWKGWLNISETGRTVDAGPYRNMIDRSALVLKLLYYEPTGTIAAAATTSLPEQIGGERNWDYRYTWVRDTSFTLQALFNLGHLSETEGYIRWIEKLLSEHGAGKMQIMYGLRGEEKLPEEELDHLEGYKGSRPVRIGNEAAAQKQLDIYGELMDAALKLSDYVGKIDAMALPSGGM
jgi:GH15 family glucan-1,4-alpha-glucosidase